MVVKEQVVELLEGNKSHYTPMMKAAVKGDLNQINILLAKGRDPVSIQAGFELAADEGHAEVAQRLVEVGADNDFGYYNQKRSNGEGKRCPFCYSMASIQGPETCEHLFCIDLHGYDEFWGLGGEEFYKETELLCETLNSITPGEFEELVEEAPHEIAGVYERVKKSDLRFWSNDPGIEYQIWGWTIIDTVSRVKRQFR